MTANASGTDKVWAAVEVEKKRDRFLKRVSVAAWTVTIAFVLLLGTMVGMQVSEMATGVFAGVMPRMALIGVAMPFIIICGVLSVLIATLATVGMFLRQRTASLTEIQMRLASLEEMIASRS